MMPLTVSLRHIQHIRALRFSFDLERNGLTAIVGKNGAGKTTLAKALRNISFADTFTKTSAEGIFTRDSFIVYSWDGVEVTFSFDPGLQSLNSRMAVPSEWKSGVSAELSIPFGERFNFFKSISNADLDIRRALILEEFAVPVELIAFLKSIYADSKFDALVEIRLRGVSYYCIRMPDDRYVREDYFSSGEYFLVSLYKRIRASYKLIFIDEIDISLDASAQVRLVTELRRLCAVYKVNVAFTTHSLAMMRTLGFGELYYMDRNNSDVEIRPASYNYIKSLLFGFRGWDRYILTEDDVLKEFLEYVISRYCQDVFYKYIVIYVGGSSNVTDMLKRNAAEGFFSDANNVIAVLDGDQRQCRPARTPSTVCIPIESIEKALHKEYQRPDFTPRLQDYPSRQDPKSLFKQLISQELMSKTRIFAFLCDKNDKEIREFAMYLGKFLGPPGTP